jgi:hypothetical protein
LAFCRFLHVSGLMLLPLAVQAGVNAAPEAILTSLIRADTASAFNVTIGGCAAWWASLHA